MFDDRQLSRIRAITHAVVADANRRQPVRTLSTVRRTGRGAQIQISLQGGGNHLGSDPLNYLGSVCDQIVGELRLERDGAGRPTFGTEEPTFAAGDAPVFSLEVLPR